MLRRTFALPAILASFLILGGTASAESPAITTLTLAPHCIAAEQSSCPSFAVLDAEQLTTERLSAGDILDIDIVLSSPDPASIQSIRSWLKYDPAVLEARSVEFTNAVSSPSPDEQGIDKLQGLIKLGGSANGKIGASSVSVARITFRVMKTTADTTLSFFDFLPDGTGHTGVNGPMTASKDKNGVLPAVPCFGNVIGCRGTPKPLLTVQPASLAVILLNPDETVHAAPTDTGSASSPVSGSQTSGPASVGSTAKTQSSAAAQANSATSLIKTTAGSSTFPMLQVQSVQVTTRDRTVFIGWHALKSTEIAGYNVYYGTVSGRYIQRRSAGATETSMVLRDLEPGTRYYLAVRAFNSAEQESAFSQEVSVVVGKPETATAPLTASIEVGDIASPPPAENVIATKGGSTVRGETGTSDVLSIILLLSAAIGTTFAFRRQLTLPSA